MSGRHKVANSNLNIYLAHPAYPEQHEAADMNLCQQTRCAMILSAQRCQVGRQLFAFPCGQQAFTATWRRPSLPGGNLTAISRQQTRNNSSGSCFPLASAGTFHEILLEENKELRAQLRKTLWPPLTSFEAYGKTYSLPLTTAMTTPIVAPAKPTDSMLRYLAGFFDGDGSCHNNGTRIALQISQSYDRAEILVLFRSMFGGGIYRKGNGAGLHKPALYWYVSGGKAVSAAGLLAPKSIVKRAQLEIARDWLRHSADTATWMDRLKLLKQYDSSIEAKCTWEYIAGFFDAEGYIHLFGRCGLRLEISQKFITVLECIARFLAQEVICNLYIRRSKSIFKLDIALTPACKSILRNMLAAGLIQKADQARLALSVTPENSQHVQSSLGKKMGNQCFGRRRDAEGLKRARLISNAQARARAAWKKGQQDKAFAAWQEAAVLKADHALQNARLENSQLNEYVQMLQSLQQQGLCMFKKFARL